MNVIDDRELVAASSGGAPGLASWLKKRPEPVLKLHLVTVAETPRVVSGLSGARYSRPHRQRGGPTAATKRGGQDYRSLDLHAHGGTLLGSSV